MMNLVMSSRWIISSVNAKAQTDAMNIHKTGINAVFQNGIPGAAAMRNPLYIATKAPQPPATRQTTPRSPPR
jgi:hypothetical protein